MTLEFLAPDSATPFNGASPELRSPIEWVHRELGAELADRGGWRVVKGYGATSRESAASRRTSSSPSTWACPRRHLDASTTSPRRSSRR